MINSPFAIYRLPFADECTVVVQESGVPEMYDSIAELKGRSGFVMIPFFCGGSQRIVLIRPDRMYSKAVVDVASEIGRASCRERVY